MENYQKIILIALFLIGIWVPFTVVSFFEFFLIIPLVLIFAFSVLLLISSFITKSKHFKDSLFMFLIIPVFILSQVLSVILVYNLQLARSERIIADLEVLKQKNGSFPKQYDVGFGIDYKFEPNDGNFSISYSRGFLVTEHYDSESKMWVSHGFD